MTIASRRGLFLHEICELYDAEQRFVEGQQEVAQEVTDRNLESTIRKHLEQTRLQIRNLEEVFGELGEEARRETNEVAQGLVSEAQEGIREAQNDAIRDCAIDVAVIKVEHFEIGAYRSLIAGARLMEQDRAVDLLEQNLRQEEETAQIAEQSAWELLRKARQAEQ